MIQELGEKDAAWVSSQPDRKQGQTLVELIERQCQRTPQKVAVVFENEQLSYRELDIQATRLANYLRDRGVGPETLVGLCVDRSPGMLVALFGILKAGGAYLPLDVDFPAERLQFMLEDSGTQLLLTEQRLVEHFSAPGRDVICLDTALNSAPFEEELSTKIGPYGDDLAYVIYTSGSTGRPKGVMIEHAGFLNMLQSMAEEPGIDSSDVLLALATISFDIAGLELFLPLTVGARVVIASRAVARDPGRLLEVLRTSEATIVQATPATWRMLLQSGWTGESNLKILCGAEALSRDLADALLDRSSSLWNVYGPTETTVWATVAEIKKDGLPVSIGHPIANMEVYIVDEKGEQCPVGVAGELYIAGTGVARGYLKRPELTEERFIPNPFGPSGSRVYRTGDEAKFRADGALEYLGRRDDQVKIRGYRIELGEIETALRRHPAVRDSVVAVKDTEAGESQLAAFVIPASDAAVDGPTLRTHLQQILPEYMVPSVFANVSAFPVTPTGKIDRKALTLPRADNRTVASDFVAPRTNLEEKLVEVFERVLDVRPVSVTANFFSLGGHSLLAVRLFSEIANLCGSKLPPSTLFRAPTVELLAEILTQEGVGQTWTSLVPIKASGNLPPVFCVHPRGSNLVRYHALANLLGPDQPFYGLQSTAVDEKQAAQVSVESMATEYIAALRKIQPEGPYNLAGWSFGGTVAFEMAQQLVAKGEKVGLLALIDSFFPGRPAHFERRALPGTSMNKLDVHSGELLFARPGQRLKECWSLLEGMVQESKTLMRSAVAKLKHERTLPEILARIEKANERAEQKYTTQPYDGRVTLFWCSDWAFRAFHDTRLGWSDVAERGLELHVVPGNHKTMWMMPNVGVLADKLKKCLKLSHDMVP